LEGTRQKNEKRDERRSPPSPRSRTRMRVKR
jgi:hypothetical protein